jgi:muramidase (phage lysozyme)
MWLNALKRPVHLLRQRSSRVIRTWRTRHHLPQGSVAVRPRQRWVTGMAVAITVAVLLSYPLQQQKRHLIDAETADIQPLAMRGGNPYLRALMRTISASESNVEHPYHVIYGGEYIQDLSRHPDLCVPIGVGPNQGNCTTAAGRYQMLTTTWYEQAKRYHPKPWQFLMWQSYSFEAQYQDAVVYAWLSDPDAWGVDIAELLQQGRLNEVLELLSGTWTSLGYGIEDNSMTASLPAIYQQMLAEER